MNTNYLRLSAASVKSVGNLPGNKVKWFSIIIFNFSANLPAGQAPSRERLQKPALTQCRRRLVECVDASKGDTLAALNAQRRVRSNNDFENIHRLTRRAVGRPQQQ